MRKIRVWRCVCWPWRGSRAGNKDLEMLFAMADEIESSHEQRELASPAPASSQRDPVDKDRGWLRVHNVGGSLTFLLQVFPFSPLFFQIQTMRLPFVMCFFKIACFLLGLFSPPRLFSCFFFIRCVCAFVFFGVAIRAFLGGFTCSSVCRGFQF